MVSSTDTEYILVFILVTNYFPVDLKLYIYVIRFVKAMDEERKGDCNCISQWLLARPFELFREGLCRRHKERVVYTVRDLHAQNLKKFINCLLMKLCNISQLQEL